jgi:hypothetical protein
MTKVTLTHECAKKLWSAPCAEDGGVSLSPYNL